MAYTISDLCDSSNHLIPLLLMALIVVLQYKPSNIFVLLFCTCLIYLHSGTQGLIQPYIYDQFNTVKLIRTRIPNAALAWMNGAKN